MPNILIVDDDEQMRAVIRGFLERAGYTVFEASNGDEGMAVYQTENIPLVITDIVMPDCDGIEMILELHQSGSKVGIIAISGGGLFDSAEYLKMAKLLGAHRILAKPFTSAELLASVAALLPGVQAAPPA